MSTKESSIKTSELIKVIADKNPGDPEFDEAVSELERTKVEIVPDKIADGNLLHELKPYADGADPFFYTNSPVRVYLREIAAVPALSPHREAELLGRIAMNTKDRQARKELMEAHLDTVVKIALRYHFAPGLHLLDVVQQGNLGLMQAADLFEVGRGYGFTACATVLIHRAISNLINPPPQSQQSNSGG